MSKNTKPYNPSKEETLPSIPIQNPNDPAEVAVKIKLNIGQIFPNGYSELYKTIGIENLGMKKQKGELITDVSQLKGGKQKEKAQKILKQYVDVQKLDLKRYALQIIDIFETPYYIEKDNKNTRNGFYKKYLTPLMVFYLLHQNQDVIFTNVEELSFFVGLVSKNYKNISLQTLAEINPGFTKNMLDQFYIRCKPELESVIFRILNSLQDNHRVLNYYKNYCIYTDDDSYHTSSKNEDSIIRQAEWDVLREFNAKYISTIFQRNQQEKFYNRVLDLINETYGYNWVRYKKQIQIFVDNNALNEIMQDLTNEQIHHNKKKISSRLAKRMINKTQSDYNRTNTKAEEIETSWVKKQLGQPDITELVQIGFEYENRFKEMAKNITFRYHDGYLDTQKELITLMIGEEETKNK